jgi:hypothetical protein
MRLVRFGEARTGILLDLPTGPHIQDVVASVGALSSEDPISIGILNGILKDGGTWGPLIEHWASARVGLGKLVHMASSTPGTSGFGYDLDLLGLAIVTPDSHPRVFARFAEGARKPVWVIALPSRGFGFGPAPRRALGTAANWPHQRAGNVTAPDQCCKPQKVFAKAPSTRDPKWQHALN